MGIKKDKLLRLGNKLLPLKVKKLLVKHKIVKNINDTRALVYKDADVVEFWLSGFNDDGLIEPFKPVSYTHLRAHET